MGAILEALAERASKKADDLHGEERRLLMELRETETKIDRLYDALSSGLVESSDGFKRNLPKLEQRRDELLRQTSRRKRQRQLPTDTLSQKNIDRFIHIAKQKLRDGNKDFRKQYMKLFVERVEVRDEEIRISGPELALADAIAQTAKPVPGKVPRFDAKWWCAQSRANASLASWVPVSLINRERTGKIVDFASKCAVRTCAKPQKL